MIALRHRCVRAWNNGSGFTGAGKTAPARWPNAAKSSSQPTAKRPDPRSDPFGQRRQAHQHRIGVMPGGQPETRAPVIDKVVFRIKPAMDKLHILVRLVPVLHPPLFHQRYESGQKGAPDILRQREIRRPVARIAIIHEDPADTTRPLSVRDIEILVRPFLEMRVNIGAMRVQMRLLGGVKMRRVLVILNAGVEVGPAPEPPGPRRPE